MIGIRFDSMRFVPIQLIRIIMSVATAAMDAAGDRLWFVRPTVMESIKAGAFLSGVTIITVSLEGPLQGFDGMNERMRNHGIQHLS